MYLCSNESLPFCLSLQLFASVFAKTVELALPLTSVNVSRVTQASGVKSVCINDAFSCYGVKIQAIFKYTLYMGNMCMC